MKVILLIGMASSDASDFMERPHSNLAFCSLLLCEGDGHGGHFPENWL